MKRRAFRVTDNDAGDDAVIAWATSASQARWHIVSAMLDSGYHRTASVALKTLMVRRAPEYDEHGDPERTTPGHTSETLLIRRMAMEEE